MEFRIRAATREDCRDIFRMIRELAVYEKMLDKVKISHEVLERDGFSENPFFHCLVAEVPQQYRTMEGYTLVGYALYSYTYSTWKGRSVYMEDLYVMPEFRGQYTCGCSCEIIAKEQQCVRLNFSVLDWNKPSMDFYLAKGAQNLTTTEGWHCLRFEGEALDKLAEQALNKTGHLSHQH
ncbi:diamine acetyltransferase 2-like isoform X1 [Arapaima gigas]